MNRFLLTTFFMLITRFYDVFTTYLYIPDLKGETNILVSMLGLGWIGTIITQILILLFLTYTLYIYHFKKVETIDLRERVSIKEFVSIFYFNESASFYKIFYKTPTNPYSSLYTIGGIVPKALIIISLIVGTSNIFLIFSQNYQAVYEAYHISAVLISIVFLTVFLVAVNFFKRERETRINPKT